MLKGEWNKLALLLPLTIRGIKCTRSIKDANNDYWSPSITSVLCSVLDFNSVDA